MVVLNCKAHLYVGKWSEVTEKVLDLRPKVEEGADCTQHTNLHTPSNRHVPHMGKAFQLLQISKRVLQQIYYTIKTKDPLQHVVKSLKTYTVLRN